MTDLTEQWKKGELPDGWYYCYVNNEEYKFLYFDGDCFELDDPETKSYYFFSLKDCENIKVLAPVPSYEQWQAKLEENAKLKELLKRIKDYLPEYTTPMTLLVEIDELLGEDR